MPTKLFELAWLFQEVTRSTLIPVSPEKPSPPPGAPTPVEVPFVESTSAKDSPSPPVPPLSCAVKEAVSPAVGTGLAKKADPAEFAVAGVSWIAPADWVAAPLACQSRVGAGRVPAALPVSGSYIAPC